MIFRPLELDGIYVIEPENREDSRGSFARTFCAEAFATLGLATNFVQCSASRNAVRGTLRGLHFQAIPHPEAKLVRCVRGAAFDVVVDIRPSSTSYGQWISVELSEKNGRQIYVPEGCAHGFQTLCDDTELFYQISVPYRTELARGIRWDDPHIGIDWPVAGPELSDRDRNFPGLNEITTELVSVTGSAENRPGPSPPGL
ncbi:MAG: dTDP-4-dehydrorhamnose 3,5-epimerase [Alphaproteobacteria bacterium]|jgi:dTDP-4-dehydrorhamnose 3,5-epimerase